MVPAPAPEGLKGCVVVWIVDIPAAPVALLLVEEEGACCCERGNLGGRGGRYSGRNNGARAVAERVVRGVNPVVVATTVGFHRGTKSSPADEWDRSIRCFVISAVCDMESLLVPEWVSSKALVMSARWVDRRDCDRSEGDRNDNDVDRRVLVGESLPLPLPPSSYLPPLLLLPTWAWLGAEEGRRGWWWWDWC